MTRSSPAHPAPQTPSAAKCNICGSSAFKPGPGGRQFNGKDPVCTHCGSLERHRVYREILSTVLADDGAANLVALQFSVDPSIETSWFRSLENSIYGHRNSLDIQEIALPNGAYDIVICNHVVEHVPDDVAAIRELCRISSNRGFLFLSVPNPAERETTDDWGTPDETKHGHYRVYGYDLVKRLGTIVPDMWIVLVRGADPITGRQDMGFIFSRNRKWHDLPIKKGMRAKSVHRPE